MHLEDALFNWLQMNIVAEARPDDRAASDTRDFFLQILTEDHHIVNVGVAQTDDAVIHVIYETGDGLQTQLIPREAAEQLLAEIVSNPKYNEQ
ncbi:DUF4247 domain-containing protein [Paenibacillus tarimensis]|uniref:DUF4247 domain-containing protein n=1 Tax=Paenibacillus tarimensis TaxID=416012 RepID=UPI001F464A55|nr:DUF4247 domain-containing protein [Paenibacillus tarimensis]MCF2942091.1 DUF4247 domain-containing protein [Paenibacillus tarimensis]